MKHNEIMMMNLVEKYLHLQHNFYNKMMLDFYEIKNFKLNIIENTMIIIIVIIDKIIDEFEE